MASMQDSTLHIHTFRLGENGEIVRASGAPRLSMLRRAHEWQITSPDDKEKVIAQLERMLAGDDEAHDFLRQRAALMVDEMLENALYAAPRDANGGQLFPKGDRRGILPEERIILRCDFDGERLSLEVSDSWGSLSPETVQHFIALNLADDGVHGDRAGRGLFFMWRLMDDFYVRVTPGEETSIGGALPLYPHPNI